MRKATPEEQALWPAPNYDDPEDLHAPVIGVTVTTFILAMLFLITRILSKKLMRQRLEEDDHLMLAAMAVAIPMSIFPLVCLNLGLGIHVWDQKPEWSIGYAKVSIAALNSFIDLMIYLRPVKPLLATRMPAKQRWGLMLYYVELFYDSVDELWNASIVWALMMIEMNLGVVCGCLFGIQPVLAMLFPELFASAYPSGHRAPTSRVHRQESDHSESRRSFQAYPLADLSGHVHNTPLGEADTFEALWTPEGTGSNYASASSGGRRQGELLTPGVITVHKEFTVKERITPCQSPVSDLERQLHFMADVRSEDWILDDICLKD
ncbi:hypothetical protein E8E11_002417 [Didymella keratinophila]|nr:hypothetical protein E8E11_002417 [Didymella keratinophila]